MARKSELHGEFPKLTQGHMDMIARALSYCLSDQFGEDIVFRFVPKTEATERTDVSSPSVTASAAG